MPSPASIQACAQRLGFSLCGFTQLKPPRHANYVKRWYQEKKYAGMAWMARNQHLRLNPAKLVPGAKTAIVVALSYQHDAPQTLPGEGLARYARGRDYHLWMKERLARLAAYLTQDWPDLVFRCLVDTGPILERDLAAQAGIGWIGKNTCLIHRETGSFVFLGVILIDRDLPADQPAADECGRCRLCLDACPTGALQPYQMDPSLCLSYQNIEKRGQRAQEFWPLLGDHLVGCDICQEVCPFNREPKLAAPLDWTEGFKDFDVASLTELLTLTRGAFRRKFGASAVARIRFEDFMRNVFLMLARHKRSELLPEVFAWQKRHPRLNLAELDFCVEELQRCAHP